MLIERFGLPRAFWVLWAGQLINRLGGFLFLFLPLYLTKRGFTIADAGLVATFFGAGQLLAAPVGGWLADRLPRRAALLYTLSVATFSLGVFSFITEPYWLMRTAALFGFTADLYRPALLAAVADVVKPADRTKAYGVMYWAINLGFTGAAFIGSALIDYNLTTLVLVDAGTTLVFLGCVLFAFFPTEEAPRSAGGRSYAALQDPAFVRFFVAQALIVFAFMQSHVALSLDMIQHGLDAKDYGPLVAINGIVILLVQPMSLPIFSKWKSWNALAFAGVFVAIGVGSLQFAYSYAAYGAAIVFYTIGELAFSAAAPAIVAGLSPSALRGQYQGIYQLSWSGSFMLAPAVGAYTLAHYGSATLWTSMAAIALVGAGLHLVFRKHYLRAEYAAETSDTN